ncbi:MAG: NAD-binding protein, partial [SAR324 cluster bacterium]|nr:NAD-binding protein [SAR324 cluster bacterium]
MKSEINRILIIGIGGVGLHLARRLDHEGYEVTVLESDVELLKNVSETFEFSVVHGNAMDLSSWEAAGASGMDLLITATNDDAVNMLACIVAERLGIKRRIARLRTMDFDNLNSEESRSFHIDLVVHPEQLIAQEVQRLVRRSSGNDMVDVGNGNMRVLGLRVTDDSPLVGMTPRELSKRYTETDFRVVALARGITTIIPQADESIVGADQVFIMALTQNMDRLMREIGVEQGRVRRLAILGGGLIGQRAAQLLEDEVEVRLIERDPARAE